MNSETLILSQECVICGSVYVDGQNLGDLDLSLAQLRANSTGERVDKDKDVENLDLSDPAELKSSVTIPPAAIHPTVGSGLFCFV